MYLSFGFLGGRGARSLLKEEEEEKRNTCTSHTIPAQGSGIFGGSGFPHSPPLLHTSAASECPAPPYRQCSFPRNTVSTSASWLQAWQTHIHSSICYFSLQKLSMSTKLFPTVHNNKNAEANSKMHRNSK